MRTRRELVHQYLARPIDEHFHRQKADDIEFFGNRTSQVDRGLADRSGDISGDDGDVEDMVSMNVFRDRKSRHLAVGIARDDDADLFLKIDRALKDEFVARASRPNI